MAKSSFALLALAATTAQSAGVNNHANPIRKVVTMLQNLKAKVEGEGAKEREIHEKYMCYCKNGASSLEKSVADAGPKIAELESSIKEAEAKKAGIDGEIENHLADQVTAKTDMEEATALRAKEKATFDSALAEGQAELGPINEALTLLGHGHPEEAAPAEAEAEAAPAEAAPAEAAPAEAAEAEAAPAEEASPASFLQEQASTASFLQSGAAQALKKVVQARNNMNDGDRTELLSFLSDGADSEYAPADGEIVGILVKMRDDVHAEIAELEKTEAAAIESYDGTMAAKKEELAPIQEMIEEKRMRAGKIPVDIVEMKNDLGYTGEQIVEDKKFLADLGANCATKEKFFEENVKMRGQEIQALADTIKVLNDDDALELFKKTLPAASSFLQISESTADMRARALSTLSSVKTHNVGVDFIVLSLQGKKVGSDKVVKLIDDLVAALKQEGQDDADKKEYCAKQFDEQDDKKKVLEVEVGDHESTINDLESMPAQLTGEIDALGDGIRELDKSVAEATAQRKEEADAYAPLMANDATAKELILFAKNRLNKFYNPKQYKAPADNLSDEDRATLAAGGTLAPTEAGGIAGTGIGFAQQLPPPPAAVEAYSKKSEQSNGVIALMDLIVKDLDKEMTEAELTEKNAQKDYENFMKDAAAKRSKDSQALTDKEGALADTKARLGEAKDAKAVSDRNLMATEQFIGELHAECDWLIKYFDMRKEARNGEIDAMGKAKAILKGADYSFLQTKMFLHKH
jgi:septal ring factor EnvC (AmiA/AmiB activator)